MCLAQGPQRSDAGEARTRGPSVSSQALYHWATALPNNCWLFNIYEQDKFCAQLSWAWKKFYNLRLRSNKMLGMKEFK